MESAAAAEQSGPLSAENFLSILKVATADLAVAETPAQFDEAFAVTLLLLQVSAVNQPSKYDHAE